MTKETVVQNFFIAGLPRSRTAWFAAYLSAYPDVWCWHEGIKGCHDAGEFKNKMQPWGPHPAELMMGNSDSGLPLLDVDTMFPDAPVVIIHRQIDEVLDSLRRVMGLNLSDKAKDVVEKTRERILKMDGLAIAFDSIDVRMPEIMEWIGLEYRADIHTLYRTMNIQTTDLEADATSYAWLPYG